MKSNRTKFSIEVVRSQCFFFVCCSVVSVDAQSPGIFSTAKRSHSLPVLRREAEQISRPRLIARHMERHMAGTRFMVVNKPGAGA